MLRRTCPRPRPSPPPPSLRERLPEPKIRVVKVVDLMKLQSPSRHPRGLSDTDFNQAFAKKKLIEHKQYIDEHGQDLPEIRSLPRKRSTT